MIPCSNNIRAKQRINPCIIRKIFSNKNEDCSNMEKRFRGGQLRELRNLLGKGYNTWEFFFKSGKLTERRHDGGMHGMG